MKIEFYNCPEPQAFDGSLIKETPAFVDYKPNFDLIEKIAFEFRHFKNILVIGHGGSVTSLQAIYDAFPHLRDRLVYFLSTVDPDYIHRLKQSLHQKNTLVVAISKSGTTVTMLEALSQFFDYPMLVVSERGSPLEQLAAKLKAKFVEHPPIGGRFVAMTEVALLPAALAGLDGKALFLSAEKFYKEFHKDNLAYKVASVFWQLEQNGYVDVFIPVYSKDLLALSPLITQLCHESFGKNGLGQTYLVHEAPESQHHTNQRFLGGRKNMAGLFLNTENFHNHYESHFTTGLHSIAVRNHALAELDKISLQQSMQAEFAGTLEDVRINGIPACHVSVTQVNYEEFGGLLAFWQLFAVYSAALRGLDPFNQPAVENSKNISMDKRLKFKGLA